VPSRLTVRRAVILGSGAGVGFIRAALEAIAELRGFRLRLLSPTELQSLEPGDLAVSPDSIPPTPAGVIRLDGGGLNDLLESPLVEAGLDPGFPSAIESRWLGEPSELALQPVTASQLAVERTRPASGEAPAGTGRAWLLGALALFVAERFLAARRREALA